MKVDLPGNSAQTDFWRFFRRFRWQSHIAVPGFMIWDGKSLGSDPKTGVSFRKSGL
jgi:hypothetical protein